MSLENGDWPDDERPAPEPDDESRVLRPRLESAPQGPIDYADAITARDAAWWSALSDYEYTYGLLRALESAAQRGAPVHLARCVHHLHDLLSGLDTDDRRWFVALFQRLGEMLAYRAGATDAAVRWTALFNYLADIAADPRFTPPLVLPVGLTHQMYPHGASPDQLREALDRSRYPKGKPLPVCPLCEADQADPADPLARAIGKLPHDQRSTLRHLGEALALDAEAPDLAGQLAWVVGDAVVPASYLQALEQARKIGV